MEVWKQIVAVPLAFGAMYGLIVAVPLLFSWHGSGKGLVAAVGGIACAFACLALLH